MLEFSGHVIGLAMVIGSLVVFVLLMPRGGQVNPILRTDFVEQVALMCLIFLFFAGGVMALAGFPLGMGVGTK